VREEQNNLIIFSSEREYFRDIGLKNSDFYNTHKENGCFSCEKRIDGLTEQRTYGTVMVQG